MTQRSCCLLHAAVKCALVVALAAAVLLPAAFGQATSLKDIQIPPLPPFHPQEPTRVALPNGMVIFLQPDRELPLISGVARIRGGSRDEPASKVGLVDIYGEVWRTGGTKLRTGDQLDEFLEARAAKVETNGVADSTLISFDCLKQDFEPVFAVFLELLHEPVFREEKIELAKQQMYTGIARRNDDINAIASREAVRLAYGRDNPYARIPEYDTVAAVTRQDLLNWHQTYVHPNNIIFGIVGDFDPAQMETRLRQAFESWQRAPVPPEPVIKFQPPQPGNYFIAKEDVNQSSVRIVGLGMTRRNPDYFAVEVMNEIFGGGFSSRLFTTIRSKLGLAYSVGGGIGAGWDHPGIFNVSAGTKSDSTYQTIQALQKELDNLLKEPIAPDELKRAKDSILNSFIFNFDSKEEVLLERMRYEFYGYPPDFLERYRAGIEKATADDVKRVAIKYIHPQELALLVAGNPQPVLAQLQQLGPIHTVDITIPPPTKAAAAAQQAAGKTSGANSRTGAKRPPTKSPASRTSRTPPRQ